MSPTLPSLTEGARSLQPKSSSCLENRSAESLAGKGAAKAAWVSRHGDMGSSLGRKSSRSGWGVVSQR